ncbi:MAG: hypothetical protein ACT4TC_07835 [Myxococcaceae bacterium]
MKQTQKDPLTWRAIPYALAILGVLLTVGLSLLVQRPSDIQYFVMRVVLALGAAGAAAVIPGLLRVELSRGIRAGGALAVFVVIYFANPPSPPSAASTGAAVPEATVQVEGEDR